MKTITVNCLIWNSIEALTLKSSIMFGKIECWRPNISALVLLIVNSWLLLFIKSLGFCFYVDCSTMMLIPSYVLVFIPYFFFNTFSSIEHISRWAIFSSKLSILSYQKSLMKSVLKLQLNPILNKLSKVSLLVTSMQLTVIQLTWLIQLRA